MGWLDEEGNIHLTGRLKELIIRGGENISPAEIETALGSCPEIAECKAIGVPDRHYGEEVCLCVVPRDGTVVDTVEIRALLVQKLAEYKVPKYIVPLDELPKTVTGKVRPTELTQFVQERLKLS